MIYEIAFGIGGITKPFNVFTIRPRMNIKINAQVNEVLNVPQTLVIEEDEAAPDPVELLSQEGALQPQMELNVRQQQ